LGLSEISEKAKVRLLGEGAAVKPPASPAARPLEAPPPSDAPPPPLSQSSEPIFLSDVAEGADVLDAALTVQPLAQLCAAPNVQTPFLAAIAGPDGAGKSFALTRLAQTIEKLVGAPGALARAIVARVDAADGADAPVALASAAYAALDRDPGGIDYSPLLDESAHAGGDPLRAAKAASDRHDEVVRRLDAERAQRDEAEARSARLADALLFETPGSRVDAFARSRRGAIEARLRRFDLAGSDAGSSYREFVRDAAGMGPGGRLGVAVRSIWAYGGQRRLLFWAIVAFLAGFALHMLHSQDTLGAIHAPEGAGDIVTNSTAKATDWVSSHGSWFETAAKILYLLGALALALNLWRAISFSTLLLRGSQLLNLDIRERRRDLDARIARLNQRVATLSADAEAAAKHAEAASRRAGGKAQTRAPGPDFLDARHSHAAAARSFLAALSERMTQGPSGSAPDRLVFAIDNLDALPPDAAIAWIEAAQSAICPGAIGVLALDPGRLVHGLGGPAEARRRFDKWLQVAVTLSGPAGIDGERLVARLLSADGRPTSAELDPKVGAALAEPLSGRETTLLTALAPLAAQSPRSAKRFLNAYRLARCSDVPRPAVALMLAAAFADEATRTAMRDRLRGGDGDLDDIKGPDALVRAVKSARAVNNGVLTVADARAADTVARRYAPLL
jgi:hypothetical protein